MLGLLQQLMHVDYHVAAAVCRHRWQWGVDLWWGWSPLTCSWYCRAVVFRVTIRLMSFYMDQLAFKDSSPSLISLIFCTSAGLTARLCPCQKWVRHTCHMSPAKVSPVQCCYQAFCKMKLFFCKSPSPETQLSFLQYFLHQGWLTVNPTKQWHIALLWFFPLSLFMMWGLWFIPETCGGIQTDCKSSHAEMIGKFSSFRWAESKKSGIL